MRRFATYGIRECARIGALIVLLVGGIVSECAARNYLRFNADFSYARDMMRSGVGPSYIEEMTPEQALEWVSNTTTHTSRAS